MSHSPRGRRARWILSSAFALLAACTQQQMASTAPFDGSMPAEVTDPGKVTWYKDVLPLVREHCQACHAPSGIAPFPLLTYADAKPRAMLMAENVSARVMPPWMPDPACGEFQHDRRLTDAQIAVFKAWVDEGAVEGDPASAPSGGDSPAQHLTSVDTTLMPERPYTPRVDLDEPGRFDDYHCFLLDPGLAQDRYLVGFEVVPGVARQVHHVLLHPANAAEAWSKDDATPGDGWTCFGGPGLSREAVIGAWAPGMPPNEFPTDTGILLKKGELIVMQVHYNLLNGPPVPDQTIVKLDYADGPIDKPATITGLAKGDFNVPPQATNHTETGSLVVPGDVQVWGLLPHMHTLGKRINVKSDSRCLIDIPRWDFHWQQMYFYKQPVTVKAGEVASVSCTWDNPRDTNVTWGESTTDEMCLAYVYHTN